MTKWMLLLTVFLTILAVYLGLETLAVIIGFWGFIGCIVAAALELAGRNAEEEERQRFVDIMKEWDVKNERSNQ